MTTIKLHLGNPHLTLLHRAGLAGLWMTLKYFETHPQTTLTNLKWKLSHRQMILAWEGNDLEILDHLLKASFQLCDGLISFPCLDSQELNDLESRLRIHQGMLGTFLQHNSTHTKQENVTKNLQIDEDSPPIIINYKALSSYAHQDFASKLCDHKGQLLTQPINVAGWLNPGAVVRHVAFSSQTSIEENIEGALMLLFAPIACNFYQIKSKLKGNKAQFALVIPEITDLEKYANYKLQPRLKNAGYQSFYASSLGEAGLQFLVETNVSKLANKYGLKSCEVVTLGTVPWSTQQKTRTDLYTVTANQEILDNYRLVCYYFADQVITTNKNEGYFVNSLVKEFITDNLARGKLWYANFYQLANNQDLFKKVSYEKGGLFKMIQKSQWDQESKKLFIDAFHEKLYYLYGKEGSKDSLPNFERINAQIRHSLLRAKNATALRKFLVDFFSREGKRSTTLQKNRYQIMLLITENNDWQLTRDLALLALASYTKPQSKYHQNQDAHNSIEVQEHNFEEEEIDIF